jgi:hypothetical protein
MKLPSFGVELAIIVLIGLILIVPFWKIFSKAGFSGWLSLTQIIPVLNLAGLYYLAFVEWPSQRRSKGCDGEGKPYGV